MVRVLDRAVELVETTQAESSAMTFQYMAFLAYYTKTVSLWPWKRNGVALGFAYVLMFYLFTPIFFCYIMDDHNICPGRSHERFSGWMGAFFFASATLSTVGYG